MLHQTMHKRESGVNPELSRSGKWKRPPSPRKKGNSTVPISAWEATVSRPGFFLVFNFIVFNFIVFN